MLCLTRYSQQSIMIGDNIKIKVLRIVDDRVFLGIHAPREVRIDREEVHDDIKEHGRRTGSEGS